MISAHTLRGASPRSVQSLIFGAVQIRQFSDKSKPFEDDEKILTDLIKKGGGRHVLTEKERECCRKYAQKISPGTELYRGCIFSEECMDYICAQQKKGKQAVIPIEDAVSFSTSEAVAISHKPPILKKDCLNTLLRVTVRNGYGVDLKKIGEKIGYNEKEVLLTGGGENILVIPPDGLERDPQGYTGKIIGVLQTLPLDPYLRSLIRVKYKV